MRALIAFGLGGLASCTLLRDYDGLSIDSHPVDDAATTRDAEPSVVDAAPDAPVATSPAIGCADASCTYEAGVCCVGFTDSAVRGVCTDRTSDLTAACTTALGTDRLAGVLECDTSAQCDPGSVCCGDGQARLDNTKVNHAACVVGSACPSSANELCGPGRAGPGALGSCRNGATTCVRTNDLDISSDAPTAGQFPLLKCSLD